MLPITEGYVTEYGDGRLFAPPPIPDAKPKKLKVPKLELGEESGVESDPEVEAIEELAAETEVDKDVELLKIQVSPETTVVETEEAELEAPVTEAKTEDPIEEKSLKVIVLSAAFKFFKPP